MVADTCDREHKGRSLLAYAEARALLAQELRPLEVPTGMSALPEALGRVLAAPVCLDRDEPPVPRSAMDGYALRSADGRTTRRVVARVFAGTAEVPEIGPGEAVAVMTGGTVPPGADCVIPVEHTHASGEVVEILEDVQARQHVRPAGEMGRRGREVLSAGRRLRHGDLAVAAACGADPLPVRARPRAWVLSTGDEVVPWTRAPLAHQVRDGNRLAAVTRLAALGAAICGQSHAPDDAAALEAELTRALDAADLVVTIGGVSMGEKDLLPRSFARLGVRELLHGVAIQPGKPVWIGRRGATWVLALPGNPVSAFVTLELFGRPMLDALEGVSDPAAAEALCPAECASAVRAKGRALWLPARVARRAAGPPLLAALPWTGSGDWSCLAGADALLHLPPGAAAAAGDAVRYLPL